MRKQERKRGRMAGSSEPAVNGIEPRKSVPDGSCRDVPLRCRQHRAARYRRALSGHPGSETRSSSTLCYYGNQGDPSRPYPLRMSMPDKLKKRGRQTALGKSEGCIVPLKPGNSGGGKAAEPSRGSYWASSGRRAGIAVLTRAVRSARLRAYVMVGSRMH